MSAIRIFFNVNEILIDSYPQPFIAGSLLATLNAGLVEIRRGESDYLFTAIPWDMVGRRDGTTFATSDEVMAYLAAEFAKSRSVGDAFGLATVAGEALAAGMPVAVSRGSGLLRLARADTYPLAFVAGLAPIDTEPGFTARPGRGVLTLDDWTAVVGAPALFVGQPYFLAPAGGLVATAINPGAACVARVGLAASPSTLVVDPTDPILL